LPKPKIWLTKKSFLQAFLSFLRVFFDFLMTNQKKSGKVQEYLMILGNHDIAEKLIN